MSPRITNNVVCQKFEWPQAQTFHSVLVLEPSKDFLNMMWLNRVFMVWYHRWKTTTEEQAEKYFKNYTKHVNSMIKRISRWLFRMTGTWYGLQKGQNVTQCWPLPWPSCGPSQVYEQSHRTATVWINFRSCFYHKFTQTVALLWSCLCTFWHNVGQLLGNNTYYLFLVCLAKSPQRLSLLPLQ